MPPRPPRLHYTRGVPQVYEEGPFTLEDLSKLLPFPNELCVVELSGAQILECLENSVSQWPKKEGRFAQARGPAARGQEDESYDTAQGTQPAAQCRHRDGYSYEWQACRVMSPSTTCLCRLAHHLS